MLDYRIKNMLVDVCQTFSSNETDEIVAEIVSEIYRLKGFEKGEGKNNTEELIKQIDSLEYQIEVLKDEIDTLQADKVDLRIDITDLMKQVKK